MEIGGGAGGRKAGGQEFTEGSRQRLRGGGCVLLGWAVFRGAIPYRQRGWEAREGDIGDISLPLKDFFLHLCQYQLFLGRHGQPAPAPLSGRRGPQTSGSQAGTPPPGCCFSPWRYSSAARPLNFRGGEGPARSALQLRGLVGLLGPAPQESRLPLVRAEKLLANDQRLRATARLAWNAVAQSRVLEREACWAVGSTASS